MSHQLTTSSASKTTRAYWAKIPTMTLVEAHYVEMMAHVDLVEGEVLAYREVRVAWGEER